MAAVNDFRFYRDHVGKDEDSSVSSAKTASKKSRESDFERTLYIIYSLVGDGCLFSIIINRELKHTRF